MSQIRTFLAGCTTMAAALAAVVTLTGAKDGPSHAQFDEITVGRINIVEPNGTKRLIISNRAQFPGAFEQGKEIERPDRRSFAGMLFIDEEGNENGGFIQKGSRGPDGKINAGLSLTFDRYRQDQALQLKHMNNEKNSMAGITINDVPFYENSSIEAYGEYWKKANAIADVKEREAYWNGLIEQGKLMQKRAYLGTNGSRDSSLVLSDAKGRPRLRMAVSAAGQAIIEMLDEEGKVVKAISADK